MLCLQRPSLLRQFEGQHLANLLWGLTRSGFRPLPAFLELMAQVGWRPAALLYGIHPAGQPWEAVHRIGPSSSQAIFPAC